MGWKMDRINGKKSLSVLAVLSTSILMAFIHQHDPQIEETFPAITFKQLNVSDRGNGSFLFFNRVAKVIISKTLAYPLKIFAHFD